MSPSASSSSAASPAPEPWLAELAERLGRLIGLRLDPSTERRLVQCVRAAAKAAGSTPAAYVAGLAADPDEVRRLVDAFVVPETSFFRDEAQLTALARHVLPTLEPPVLAWSAACSTGQEAYSLAITLDETVVGSWGVLATDVSTPALERARAGRYREAELRGLSPSRRARYFRREGRMWAVDDHLREHVSVASHNLVDEQLPTKAGTCPIIFCRNVLIYFRPEEVQALVDRLYDHLPPGGWLFVGASESLWQLSGRFEVVRLDDVFAYRRPLAEPSRPAPRPRAGRASKPAPTPEQKPAARPAPARPAAPASPLPEPAELLRAGEEAHRRGDLDGAVASFRQAAYLDPDNPLAHLHVGLALEARGDAAASRRAFRAAQGALARCDQAHLEAALEGWDAGELARLLATKLEES